MDDAGTITALPPDSIETAFPTDDEDLFDSMNLHEKRTGLTGTIFLSTKVPQHGPRVKWMPTSPGPSRPTCSFTLDDPPRLVASSLSELVVLGVRVDLTAWIQANKTALLAFWNEGAYWDSDEVDAFKASLKPLPR